MLEPPEKLALSAECNPIVVSLKVNVLNTWLLRAAIPMNDSDGIAVTGDDLIMPDCLESVEIGMQTCSCVGNDELAK
jgi:hypothetical protein